MEKRTDGRTAGQLRPPGCTRGLLSRADGSAKWQQDGSMVLAGVYGPRAAGGRRENAQEATLEVIWKPKTGQPGSWEREAERVLRRTLEKVILLTLHPRTAITLILQVVHDDGSLLACAVNAGCAAMVDAGIPMRGLLWSLSCAVTSAGSILMDPTRDEEKTSQATAMLVFPSPPLSVRVEGEREEGEEREEEGLVTSVTRGPLSVDDFLTCVTRGKMAAAKIGAFFRASLESHQLGAEMVERAL